MSSVVICYGEQEPIPEDLIAECNDAVFRYWDYYTDYDTDEYAPPEYFGGFSLSPDNKLIMYLSEDSDAIRAEVLSICKKSDIIFEQVKCSFNELVDKMCFIDEIASLEIINISGLTLDLSTNSVSILLNQDAESCICNLTQKLVQDYTVSEDVFNFVVKEKMRMQ